VNNNPLRYTDPSGHAAWNDNEGSGTRCDLDCWRARHADDNAGRGPGTYHLCSNTNLYQLGWENSSQAWSIWTNPNASYGQRFGAGAYLGAWGGAHAAGVIGAAGLVCAATGPGCVAAVEGALGIGTGANVACGGDMCASEFDTIGGVRILHGNKDLIAVIGRNMPRRVEPFAKAIGAETWKGYDNRLSKVANLANNRAWAENLKLKNYTIYDIGLDPTYTSIGDYAKDIFYEMETLLFFGGR